MLVFSQQQKKNTSGFTLIEVMVAVSIFAIVITVGIGSLMTANKAYRQSQAQRAVIDNVSFVMESMAREIRTGRQYTHGTSPAPDGNLERFIAAGGKFSFVSLDADADGDLHEQNGEDDVHYYLDGTTIMRAVDGDPFAMTPDTVEVEKLTFVVDEGTSSDPKQPYVVIHITANATSGNQSSSVVMQTSVSQRLLNYFPSNP